MPRQKKKNKKKTENKMKMATAMIKKRNRERHRLNRNGHFYDGKSSRDNKKKMVAHQRVWRVANKKKPRAETIFHSFLFGLFSLYEPKKRKEKRKTRRNRTLLSAAIKRKRVISLALVGTSTIFFVFLFSK